MRLPLLLALTLAACSSSDPPLPPPDGGATDAAAADVLRVDVTEDRPAPVDLGSPDVGVDAGTPIDVLRVDVSDDRPAVDGPADAPTDSGITPQDRMAPADDAGRLLCGSSPGQSCVTNADCARCIPGIWCCAGDGPGLMECTPSGVACVGP